MANQEYLDLLKQSKDSWNTWRKQHPEIMPDLSCKIREETQQESGLKSGITEVCSTVSNVLWRQRGCYVIWNDQRFTT